MSANYKLVPYGISDFEQLRKENKYLVDKTMFFEKMERAGKIGRASCRERVCQYV